MPTEKNAAFLPTQYSFKLDRQRVKACLVMGHIPRAWRQVKMMFIPVNGKVNYTRAKAYCPISLLSFMQKMIHKFETRDVRDETLGDVPYIYKNLPTHQGCPQKPQTHHVITYIKEVVENWKSHLTFPRY